MMKSPEQPIKGEQLHEAVPLNIKIDMPEGFFRPQQANNTMQQALNQGLSSFHSGKKSLDSQESPGKKEKDNSKEAEARMMEEGEGKPSKLWVMVMYDKVTRKEIKSPKDFQVGDHIPKVNVFKNYLKVRELLDLSIFQAKKGKEEDHLKNCSKCFNSFLRYAKHFQGKQKLKVKDICTRKENKQRNH